MVSKDILAGSFTEFFAEVEPRLRHALAAALGAQEGTEAAAEAMAYGWEHWEELRAMGNPAGYLYKVGRSRAQWLRRQPSTLPPVREQSLPWVEPHLPQALGRLSEKQRVVVILVHSLGWTQTEVAELLGVSLGTVHKHIERGLKRLRSQLGVKV